MAMLKAAVAVALGVAESWTWTVKLDVPVAVGVPEMTPVVAFKVRPAGSAPAMMLQVYGGVPPMACKVWLYAVPLVPPASDVVVTPSGGSVTVILRLAVLVTAVGVCESVTDTVKCDVLVTVPVGVPEITPALLRVNPAGKLPAVMLQV
jgi:hypothetical protein